MPRPLVPRPVAEPTTLDELYWHSELTVTEIARRTGDDPRRLHRHVSPLGAGVDCRWCGAPLTYTSRSSRADHRLRCAACGATRRNPAHLDPDMPHRPAAVGGLIVVRTQPSTRSERWDPGFDIDAGIDALARAGVAWDPHGLVVLPSNECDETDLPTRLADRPPGILAVRSLLVLAATQTERLQVLFELTRRRWRVLAADDVTADVPRAIGRRELELLGDPADHLDQWGPSWAEHLVSATTDHDRIGRHRRHW